METLVALQRWLLCKTMEDVDFLVNVPVNLPGIFLSHQQVKNLNRTNSWNHFHLYHLPKTIEANS